MPLAGLALTLLLSACGSADDDGGLRASEGQATGDGQAAGVGQAASGGQAGGEELSASREPTAWGDQAAGSGGGPARFTSLVEQAMRSDPNGEPLDLDEATSGGAGLADPEPPDDESGEAQ